MQVTLNSRSPIAFDAFPSDGQVDNKGQPKLKDWNVLSDRFHSVKHGDKRCIVIPVNAIYKMLAAAHADKISAVKMYIAKHPEEYIDPTVLRAEVNSIKINCDMPLSAVDDPHEWGGWLFVRDDELKPLAMPVINKGQVIGGGWFVIGGQNFNKSGNKEGKYKGLWPVYGASWKISFNATMEMSPVTFQDLLELGGKYVGIGQKRNHSKGFGRFYPTYE